ncbi:MAG: acetyl-CoA carboxylase carboxyltransferase subunit alpha [Lachnospiraceae bacterium]|nr:acetyl-CoA carboxylase carboxyltransferase subunit alpha [Lachnospiraceae bacterium]
MKRTAWEKVRIAREMERPTSLYYIENIFDEFIEIHGDRGVKDDPAIVGGIGFLDGKPVTVIGQQKGRDLKEQIARNFGMPNPEGYRKALRLMKQAEKFGRAVVCFVDTSGAFCGIEAEERGQGEAIARSLMEMAGLTVPVVSIIIGEGGSGGALAMAVGNEVWCLENSVYSVLSPEGFAAILWKDGKRAGEAAEVMKMTSEHLLDLKIVDRVFEEQEPVHEDGGEALTLEMKQAMIELFKRYEGMSGEQIRAERYKRFRKF